MPRISVRISGEIPSTPRLKARWNAHTCKSRGGVQSRHHRNRAATSHRIARAPGVQLQSHVVRHDVVDLRPATRTVIVVERHLHRRSCSEQAEVRIRGESRFRHSTCANANAGSRLERAEPKVRVIDGGAGGSDGCRPVSADRYRNVGRARRLIARDNVTGQ